MGATRSPPRARVQHPGTHGVSPEKPGALPCYGITEWLLRHSFVSLLSDDGMAIEQISRLVGHSGTSVTELVYRKQIRPVVEDGAMTMDRLFPRLNE